MLILGFWLLIWIERGGGGADQMLNAGISVHFGNGGRGSLKS